MKQQILIVDDEEQLCISLSRLLEAEGYRSRYTLDPREALSILGEEAIDLLISDLKMPGMSGTDLIKEIRRFDKEIPVIMVSGYASVDNVVKAMRYGATNFFKKPVRFREIAKEIDKLFSSGSCNHDALSEHSPPLFITSSSTMEKQLSLLRKAAPTDAPVLITGESGTGKELAANILHSHSNRSGEPFLKINCAAIPEALLESELFGVEKGAYTDARETRSGLLEAVQKGTLFLDEVGEMSVKTQAKLLRVLQEKEFQRLGSHATKKMEARIVAATNRNLQERISTGHFREDLYYRLSVIQIELPPLRNRIEDILPLTRYFLQEFRKKYCTGVKGLSRETEQLFLRHDWPGNVRELRNSIERMVIFCEGEYLEPELLPEQYRKYTEKPDASTLESVSNSINREIILDALERSGGSRSKAAEFLGITRRTLYNKMKKLGL